MKKNEKFDYTVNAGHVKDCLDPVGAYRTEEDIDTNEVI